MTLIQVIQPGKIVTYAPENKKAATRTEGFAPKHEKTSNSNFLANTIAMTLIAFLGYKAMSKYSPATANKINSAFQSLVDKLPKSVVEKFATAKKFVVDKFGALKKSNLAQQIKRNFATAKYYVLTKFDALKHSNIVRQSIQKLNEVIDKAKNTNYTEKLQAMTEKVKTFLEGLKKH